MKKRFEKIHIEITNVCNLQCSFCPPVQRVDKTMDIGLFENIVKQAAPLTELICFHLMGEPLLHPQFDQLVSLCEKYEAKIFLVTNGALLKSEAIEQLIHPSFHQINFSLHSFFDNFPGRDPSRYLDKIFRFTEKSLIEQPDTYINYRLWNLNDPLGSQTRNTEMLKAICERFNVPIPTKIDIREKKNVRLARRVLLHFDTEFIWPSMDLPVLGKKGRCYGLKSHFGILVDGTVVPCCLDKEATISLGNIQEQSLIDILNSERAQSMKLGFQNKQLIEPLCQRCQYIERFDSAKIECKTDLA